jgi:CII-binding regulator of phage lambda lysogenization HflD
MIKRKKKSSAFTKNDAKHLEQRIMDHMTKKMEVQEERIMDHMTKKMEVQEERILRHFDVKTEQLVHDFAGIFGDRTSQHDDQLKNHEKRIVHVEEHLGLAA